MAVTLRTFDAVVDELVAAIGEVPEGHHITGASVSRRGEEWIWRLYATYAIGNPAPPAGKSDHFEMAHLVRQAAAAGGPRDPREHGFNVG